MKMKKLLAIGLVCFQLLSVGCSQKLGQENSSIKQQGTAGDLVDQTDVLAEEDLRTAKEIYKDLLDRDYANGLYYEDYSNVEKQLNEEFKAYYKNGIESHEEYYGDPYLFVSHLTFYKQTLKEVSEGTLTLDGILENIFINVKTAEWTVCHFTDTKRSPRYNYEFDKVFQKELEKKETDDLRVLRVAYEKSALDKISFEKLKTVENPYYALSGKAVPKYVARVSAKRGSSVLEEGMPLVEELKKELKEKYNEDFIFKGIEFRYDGDIYVWAPVKDPDFEFEQTTKTDYEVRKEVLDGDRYLDALSQKYLSAEVNKILEEEGVADRFVQYIVPSYHEESSSYYLKRDTSSIDDPIAFYKDYPAAFELSLIYLKMGDEEIDYEVVRRVSERVLQLFSKNNENDEIHLFVQFYNLNVDWEPAIDLFKRDVITEGVYKPNPRSFLEYAYLLDADTEAFNYIQVYGEKLDFILSQYVAYPERSLEDFVRLQKQGGPWGD